MRRFAVLLLGLSLVVPLDASRAEEPEASEIEIGALSLRLGAPESEILPTLRERYAVGELRTGLFRIAEKEQPEVMHGMVQFREGELRWASGDRGAFEGEGARDFARALFETLARMNPEDGQRAELTTQINRSPQYDVSSITLRVGARTLIVYVGNSDSVVEVSMEEILAEP